MTDKCKVELVLYIERNENETDGDLEARASDIAYDIKYRKEGYGVDIDVNSYGIV